VVKAREQKTLTLFYFSRFWKKIASKCSSTYSLLDLFSFEASLSIFSNMRFDRAMLTGCLRTVT
jgi:hypothetical protein